jgi:hypothetical protein
VCWLLGKFTRRSTNNKQRVNKEASYNVSMKNKNVEIDIPVSSQGQGKDPKYVTFHWPTHETALSIFNVSFLVKNKFLRANR